MSQTSRGGCFCLSFATCETRNFLKFKSAIDDFVSLEPAGRFGYLAFGRYDLGVLAFGNTVADITDCDGFVHESRFSENHNSYFGRIIASSSQENWETILSKNGLVGFTSIKVDDYLKGQDDYYENVGNIERSLVETLEGKSFEWVLGKSLGWEDYVLMSFGKNLGPIVNAVGEIRGLRTKGERSIKYFATTSTLPVIKLADKGIDFVGVGDELNLSWSMRLEVKPGHWNALKKKISDEKVLYWTDTRVTKTFGQADMRIENSDRFIDELSQIYNKVILPDLSSGNRIIKNVETHLHFHDASYVEGKESEDDFVFESIEFDRGEIEFTDRLETSLRKIGAPANTIRALKRIFRRVNNLASHSLLNSNFQWIDSLFRRFVAHGELLKPTTKKANRNALDEVADWIHRVERVLSDRFRGGYPAGEAVMMRLATYHSSHQMYSELIDQMIGLANVVALDEIAKRKNSETISVATLLYLGNSPNAYYGWSGIDHLGYDYIEIGVGSSFYLGDLVMVAHEIGHHITLSCLSFDHGIGVDVMSSKGLRSNVDKRAKKLSFYDENEPVPPFDFLLEHEKESRSQIKEVLAEFFSLSFCSGGNFETHLDHTLSIVERMKFHDRVRRSTIITTTVRLFAADLLYKWVERRKTTGRKVRFAPKIECSEEKIERHLNLEGGLTDSERVELESRCIDTRSALLAIEGCCDLFVEYRDLMAQIHSVSKPQDFVGPQWESVASIQAALLGARDQDLAEDFETFENLLMILRSNDLKYRKSQVVAESDE